MRRAAGAVFERVEHVAEAELRFFGEWERSEMFSAVGLVNRMERASSRVHTVVVLARLFGSVLARNISVTRGEG